MLELVQQNQLLKSQPALKTALKKLLPQLPPAIAPYPKALLVLFWATWGFALPIGEWTQKSPSLTRGRPAPSNSPPFDPMAKSA